jgi:hypothetical protein
MVKVSAELMKKVTKKLKCGLRRRTKGNVARRRRHSASSETSLHDGAIGEVGTGQAVKNILNIGPALDSQVFVLGIVEAGEYELHVILRSPLSLLGILGGLRSARHLA